MLYRLFELGLARLDLALNKSLILALFLITDLFLFVIFDIDHIKDVLADEDDDINVAWSCGDTSHGFESENYEAGQDLKDSKNDPSFLWFFDKSTIFWEKWHEEIEVRWSESEGYTWEHQFYCFLLILPHCDNNEQVNAPHDEDETEPGDVMLVVC